MADVVCPECGLRAPIITKRGGGWNFRFPDDMDNRCKVQREQKVRKQPVEWGCPHLDTAAERLIERL